MRVAVASPASSFNQLCCVTTTAANGNVERPLPSDLLVRLRRNRWSLSQEYTPPCLRASASPHLCVPASPRLRSAISACSTSLHLSSLKSRCDSRPECLTSRVSASPRLRVSASPHLCVSAVSASPRLRISASPRLCVIYPSSSPQLRDSHANSMVTSTDQKRDAIAGRNVNVKVNS
jgi:hypothetical protein